MSASLVLPGRRILFVCLGNICRSPTAEATFRSVIARAGQAETFLVDSADAPGMNRVYARFFDTQPYPIRATVVAKELLAKGLRIEITATAVLD